jgi:hypothetical protein
VKNPNEPRAPDTGSRRDKPASWPPPAEDGGVWPISLQAKIAMPIVWFDQLGLIDLLAARSNARRPAHKSA